MTERDSFPIALIEDRYGGVYSGGRWLAIAGADQPENGAYRIVRRLEDGTHGDDTDAAVFWIDPPSWIASRDTPDEAIRNLRNKDTAVLVR